MKDQNVFELPQSVLDDFTTTRVEWNHAILAKVRQDCERLNLDAETAAHVMDMVEGFVRREQDRALRFGRDDGQRLN